MRKYFVSIVLMEPPIWMAYLALSHILLNIKIHLVLGYPIQLERIVEISLECQPFPVEVDLHILFE